LNLSTAFQNIRARGGGEGKVNSETNWLERDRAHLGKFSYIHILYVFGKLTGGWVSTRVQLLRNCISPPLLLEKPPKHGERNIWLKGEENLPNLGVENPPESLHGLTHPPALAQEKSYI
jgi:hypothetical protein